jgi:hypothetical protein
VLASQDFTPDSQGELVGGSRFLNLSPPITLDTGFQGSIVIWYSDGHSERLWNSFGSSPANQAAHDAAGLQTFGGGPIEFVGGGRYGSAGDFPGTVDTGPADRYAGATFAFEPGSQVTRPTIHFARNGDKLTLMWDGGGALERTDVLGGTWQPVVGAASGIQITITGPAAYFRVHR